MSRLHLAGSRWRVVSALGARGHSGPTAFGLVAARLLDAEEIALALSVLTVLTVAVCVFLLAATVAKFSAFVSSSADAMISIDEDQRIMTFNESAEKIFGWSQAQVIGRPINILIPERFRAVHARHVRASPPDRVPPGEWVRRRNHRSAQERRGVPRRLGHFDDRRQRQEISLVAFVTSRS